MIPTPKWQWQHLFDFFEVDAGLNMALKGNVRIVNKELWKWKINSSRKSYSIHPLKSYLLSFLNIKPIFSKKTYRVNYLPFYFRQIKVSFLNFGVFKGVFLFFILSYYIFAKIFTVLIYPASSDINFDNT